MPSELASACGVFRFEGLGFRFWGFREVRGNLLGKIGLRL